MHIQFLTRQPKKREEHALVLAARAQGHHVELLDVGGFTLSPFDNGILYGSKKWIGSDIVYPFWSQYDSFMPLLLEAMKRHGQCIYKPVHATMPNKISAAMLFPNANIPCPKTYIISSIGALEGILAIHHLPLVLKLSHSSQGKGVFLHESIDSLRKQVLELCSDGTDFVIQECVYPLGVDVRAFVINGAVCAAMERIAASGEFRANIALGATAKSTPLSSEESLLVCRACALFSLETGGVDFIRTSRGPVVLEVNREPGYAGITAATGLDVAGMVVQDMQRKYAQRI